MNKKLISCFVIISLLYQACWIIVYHPHEPSFFNVVGRNYATRFDREEWRTSAYTALNWILEEKYGSVSIGGKVISYNFLSEEQKERVILEQENPTYVINGYRNVIGDDISYDGYHEVYTIVVDGYNVCSVYKKVG